MAFLWLFMQSVAARLAACLSPRGLSFPTYVKLALSRVCFDVLACFIVHPTIKFFPAVDAKFVHGGAGPSERPFNFPFLLCLGGAAHFFPLPLAGLLQAHPQDAAKERTRVSSLLREGSANRWLAVPGSLIARMFPCDPWRPTSSIFNANA